MLGLGLGTSARFVLHTHPPERLALMLAAIILLAVAFALALGAAVVASLLASGQRLEAILAELTEEGSATAPRDGA